MKDNNYIKGSGLFFIKKNSILYKGSVDNLIDKDFDSDNLIINYGGQSNECILIDLNLTEVKKVDTIISDARDFVYQTLNIDLADDFNPKTDTIIYSLNY